MSNFGKINSEKRKPFSKNWSIAFQLKVLRLKTQYFHQKPPSKKPVLRQIEWGLQNGPNYKKKKKQKQKTQIKKKKTNEN